MTRTDLGMVGLFSPILSVPSICIAGAQETGKGGSQRLPPIEKVWRQDIVLGSPLPLVHVQALRLT